MTADFLLHAFLGTVSTWVQVVGASIFAGAVALLLFLAKPLIDNTLSAFPSAG